MSRNANTYWSDQTGGFPYRLLGCLILFRTYHMFELCGILWGLSILNCSSKVGRLGAKSHSWGLSRTKTTPLWWGPTFVFGWKYGTPQISWFFIWFNDHIQWPHIWVPPICGIMWHPFWGQQSRCSTAAGLRISVGDSAMEWSGSSTSKVKSMAWLMVRAQQKKPSKSYSYSFPLLRYQHISAQEEPSN